MRAKINRRGLIFTLTLVMVLVGFMTTSTFAARKVKLYKSNAAAFIDQLNQKGFAATTIETVLGLSSHESLELSRSTVDFNKVTHKRYKLKYKGFPVWGMETIVSIGDSGRVLGLNGNLSLDNGKDIASIPSGLNPKSALDKMKAAHAKKNKNAKWTYENETYGTYVYINEKGKARLCYVVSFFADNEYGEPSRNVYFVRVKNGKVIHSFNKLSHADGQGPGGNTKIGQYYYGGATPDYPAFGVTQSGSTCTMNTTNVKTVNLNHGTSGSTAYSFTCPENTVKQINGAYSPLNDAQYFGQVVFDMYNSWYGVPPLTFQLTMRVHYSTNYENAFWNGSSMTFGDGASTFHPLVSLDVSAHEVAHGFTEQNSDLIYSGQSGGINEAYSDMAGESAEFYSRGSNDWLMGYDIYKAAGQALRYMNNPPQDGNSIDHVNDYYSGLNVHYSSGVFNKAFYLIATSSGWDTHKAFDIFTKANQDYWSASTNFQQGAEGALSAAADYGYDCTAVKNAFATVGITLVCANNPPVAGFVGSPTSGNSPLTVQFTDQSTNTPTSWSWTFTGGSPSSSTAENPSVTYNSPGSYTVSLTATNAYGSDTETKTSYITVAAPQPPVAAFTGSPTSVSVGGTVNFTDQSSNGPTGWSWSFPGGTPSSSTAQNPSVVYNTAGTYNVTLTASNAQGSDDEVKTNYITVSTQPYCTSSGNSQSYEWIAGVNVGNINNASGASGYTDFTSITGNFTQGGNVSVSLTPGFASSSYTEYWKIWIDYNGDQDFTDSGEEVFSGSGSGVVNGNFTVPGSASGTTRMRVSMSYSSAPPNCGTFSYGEVEDYTVSISGGVNYTLSTNTVGTGSITLNPSGGTYGSGTVVTCTAVAGSGYVFDGWSGDLSGMTNPQNITMNSNKSVTATFIVSSATEDAGNTTVFGSTSTASNRRAQPITMPETGTIQSITMYHTGGSGDMILGIYDDSTSGEDRIGVTPTTAVSATTGWQTINLVTPVTVTAGSTIYLAWVYQNNPGIRYQSGTPGRADAGVGWSAGMPTTFGSATFANYTYSIYVTYTPQ